MTKRARATTPTRGGQPSLVPIRSLPSRIPTVVWASVVLWLGALVLYGWEVHAVGQGDVLTGEESSVTFIDVLGVSYTAS